jgi:hypothetical protein
LHSFFSQNLFLISPCKVHKQKFKRKHEIQMTRKLFCILLDIIIFLF